MPTDIPTRPTPFRKANWTPRALEVLATAKALAKPDSIAPHHLLLAFEAGDTVALQVFRRLGMLPSAMLGHTAPKSLSPDAELYYEDFDAEFARDFPRLAIVEAKSMRSVYLGTEHLLLMLTRVGVSGVELPYERIRQTIREVLPAV